MFNRKNNRIVHRRSIAQISPLFTGVFLAILLLTNAVSCKKENSGAPLRVAVAANVQYAFDELKEEFEKETGIPVEHTLGSSGKLTAQIQNGAPFHIFLAANMKYPRALLESKDAVGEVTVYASGKVVAWSMRKSVNPENWQELLRTGKLERMAIANPLHAPYGVATKMCLEKLGLDSATKGRLAMGENLSQTNQFVLSEVVDLGFTAKSAVLSPALRGKGQWVELPAGCYRPIEQGVVILRKGEEEQKKASHLIHDFLFSQKAKEIFEKYGYQTTP